MNSAAFSTGSPGRWISNTRRAHYLAFRIALVPDAPHKL